MVNDGLTQLGPNPSLVATSGRLDPTLLGSMVPLVARWWTVIVISDEATLQLFFMEEVDDLLFQLRLE